MWDSFRYWIEGRVTGIAAPSSRRPDVALQSRRLVTPPMFHVKRPLWGCERWNSFRYWIKGLVAGIAVLCIAKARCRPTIAPPRDSTDVSRETSPFRCHRDECAARLASESTKPFIRRPENPAPLWARDERVSSECARVRHESVQ